MEILNKELLDRAEKLMEEKYKFTNEQEGNVELYDVWYTLKLADLELRIEKEIEQ